MNIVELDDYRPHVSAEVNCDCGRTFFMAYDCRLLEITCPYCNVAIKAPHMEDRAND